MTEKTIFEKARKTAKKALFSTQNAACGGNSLVAALESELSDFAPANANRFPCAEGAAGTGPLRRWRLQQKSPVLMHGAFLLGVQVLKDASAFISENR